MKQIYKILFSLCSTLICAAHSFKAFGGKCTTVSMLPDGAIAGLEYKDSINKQCKEFEFSGYLDLEDRFYGQMYTCVECQPGYELKVGGGTVYVGSQNARCDYVYDDCVPKQVPEAQCNTKADCIAKVGFTEMRIEAVDRYGSFAGFLYKDVDCVSKKCGFTFRSTACGALCANGYYSNCATMWSIAGSQGIDGCVRCPFPDAECVANCSWPVIGGGNSSGLCALDGAALWADSAGYFHTSDCSYFAS